MISHAWRDVMFGIAPVNVKTIEFSMIEQSVVNGDTPPTFEGKPSISGVPPKIASMCGTFPGSWSTTWTSKRDHRSLKQLTVSFHVCASVFHAGIDTCCCGIDEVFVVESLLPGRSSTHVRLR